MSDSLFYYTSNFVLKEWFKNGTIWATRSITSNDKTDTTYIIEHFQELKEYLASDVKLSISEIEELLVNIKKFLTISNNFSLRVLKDLMFHSMINDYNKVGFTLTAAASYYNYVQDKKREYNINGIFSEENVIENFYSYLIEQMSSDEISEILGIDKNEVNKELIKDIIKGKHPYVICFSREPDNRFFWESYTNNEGVCLELSRKDLQQHLVEKYNTLFGDVIYNKEKQFFEMKDMLKRFINVNENQDDYKLDNYYNPLACFSAVLKNPYWSVEKEVRAVFASRYFKDDKFEVKENYNLKYKREYKTQDYVEVSIPRNLIKSITIGPQNSIKNIGDDILVYFNGKINESKGKDVIKTI